MISKLSRDVIRAALLDRGFTNDGGGISKSEGLVCGKERLFVKAHDNYPLVIHPNYESMLPQLISIAGVVRNNTEQYAHSSSFREFPKRVHGGEGPVHYGLDFGFATRAALETFLDAVLGSCDSSRSPAPPSAAHTESQGSTDGGQVPTLDSVALAIEAAFREPHNERLMQWQPPYLATIEAVEQSLRSGELERAFDLVWLTHDNSVSFAGQGILGRETVERHRDDLMGMLQEIWADGSPKQFDQLVDILHTWYGAGTLPKVPRLLLARAFATVHPGRYHTTVSSAKHEAVIPWFERHTGFVAPAGAWATRAAALTEHLERSGLFTGQQARRNMFPWYVFENLGATPAGTEFRPEHVSKVRQGIAVTPGERREVQYRQNVIQDRLVTQLRAIHGDNVGSEQSTGTGGKADVLVRLPAGRWAIYEIKPADCARQAVREAVGQLLEYGYRRGAYPHVTLHIVSDAPPDPITEEYLGTLEERFNLSFEYLQLSSAPDFPSA